MESLATFFSCPTALIIMGPCGCGKSEIGQAFATHYNIPFLDADNLHPAENVRKMGDGVALTDAERLPWLGIVRNEMLKILRTSSASVSTSSSSQNGVVVACSALRKLYRDALRGVSQSQHSETGGGTENPDIRLFFIFLDCTPPILEERLGSRSEHFMKSNMLESQLKTLERPSEYELKQDCIIVNGDGPISEIIKEIEAELNSKIK